MRTGSFGTGPNHCRSSSLLWTITATFVVVAACAGEEVADTAATTASPPEATSTAVEAATTTTTPPTTSTVPVEDLDVVLGSLSPVVDVARYNGPGAMAAVDDGYVMFVNQYLRWPPNVEVHLYGSEDGVEWTPIGDGPVIDFASSVVAAASIVSSVVREGDGSWTLFFYSYEGGLASTAVSVGRATALDPGGPWTVDPKPVLTRGETWDSGTISTPTVIRTDDGYVMFYTGGTGDGVTAIGRADSADGIEWVRLDEPVFTATNDESSWDSHRVSQPNVFLTDTGAVVIYKGNSVGSLGREHGVACLPSLEIGTEWRRLGGDPIIDPSVVPGGDMIFSTEAITMDGAASLFISMAMDPNATSTAVYPLRLPIVDRLIDEGAC